MSQYRRSHHRSADNDINILLLGETGVGKTTFINAFVNCLFYDTLDDALKSDLKVLIPSSFTVADSETFDSTTIVVGDPNTNENLGTDGASSTQSCRSYNFQMGDRLLRLIDGPGVGDTRSSDHEARNFEHILTYINQYEYLNGICIFLKAGVTRLNVYFRYCVKELLRHLHVGAKDNIMFLFTWSRATFFQPGDTTNMLKVLLKDLREKTSVEVPFNQKNTFMFDNEAFRFLAVCKQGLTFLMKHKASYDESWRKSVEEFLRLIICIHGCDRHAIQDTQSLNEAQILIHKLSRPIAEITTLIHENIQMAQQYKQKLLQNQTNDNSNKIPQKVGKFVPLKERLTVCINEKCTEVVTVNGEQRINYKSHCHTGCSLHRVVQECIGHPVIRRCRALRKTGSCRECGCDWTKHMHITYRYERNVTYVDINTSSGTSRTPQSILALIDKRISDLRAEEKSIRQICVKLSQFLKANSITPFNDDMLEYLQYYLSEEKQKQAAGTENKEVIRGLEHMIEDYKNEIQLYTSSMAAQETTLSDDYMVNHNKIEAILTLAQQLYALPINGQSILEQVEKMKQGRAQAAVQDEHQVDLPRDSETSRILSKLKESVNKKRT